MNTRAEQKLREDAWSSFRAGLRAVDAKTAVQRYVQRTGSRLTIDGKDYDLAKFERVLVIGAGKAGAAMAKAVEERLGDHITDGLVNVKYGHTDKTQRIRINEAGHPVPDEAGLKGAQEILELARAAGEKDLILCLISGGGSALLPLPVKGVSLAEKQQVTRELLACGAAIQEINAVRKHISAIKGGQLARAAFPATLATLILSDVIGDALDVIASGPTAPDESTYDSAREILQRYKIWQAISESVRVHLTRGIRGEIAETPKADEEIFAKTQNVIVASNIRAILAAEERARELGYQTLILSSSIEGETREVAKVHAAIAREIVVTGHPIAPPACLISGGETTVTMRGEGKGGRNQEFVLAASIDIAGLDSVVILSGGTDGTDGPTDAAGAICDGQTVARAAEQGLSARTHLSQNNAYPFFKQLDDLLMTGPTNTNVMDLRLILVGETDND